MGADDRFQEEGEIPGFIPAETNEPPHAPPPSPPLAPPRQPPPPSAYPGYVQKEAPPVHMPVPVAPSEPSLPGRYVPPPAPTFSPSPPQDYSVPVPPKEPPAQPRVPATAEVAAPASPTPEAAVAERLAGGGEIPDFISSFHPSVTTQPESVPTADGGAPAARPPAYAAALERARIREEEERIRFVALEAERIRKAKPGKPAFSPKETAKVVAVWMIALIVTAGIAITFFLVMTKQVVPLGHPKTHVSPGNPSTTVSPK